MEKEVNCANSRAIFEYVKAHNNGDYSALMGDLHPEIGEHVHEVLRSLPKPHRMACRWIWYKDMR